MQRFAQFILSVFGWTAVREGPACDRAVLILAPHTSNWDGLWLLLGMFALDLEVRFLAKHTLFWWPLGAVLRRMGALPVNRNTRGSYVQQLADSFAKNDRLVLALAPEGTRKLEPHWKTGFYEIAVSAKVPILLGFIDYRTKRMGVGRALPAERDLEQDLEILREFYEPIEARWPENRAPIGFPPGYRSPGGSDRT